MLFLLDITLVLPEKSGSVCEVVLTVQDSCVLVGTSHPECLQGCCILSVCTVAFTCSNLSDVLILQHSPLYKLCGVQTVAVCVCVCDVYSRSMLHYLCV